MYSRNQIAIDNSCIHLFNLQLLFALFQLTTFVSTTSIVNFWMYYFMLQWTTSTSGKVRIQEWNKKGGIFHWLKVIYTLWYRVCMIWVCERLSDAFQESFKVWGGHIWWKGPQRVGLLGLSNLRHFVLTNYGMVNRLSWPTP